MAEPPRGLWTQVDKILPVQAAARQEESGRDKYLNLSPPALWAQPPCLC